MAYAYLPVRATSLITSDDNWRPRPSSVLIANGDGAFVSTKSGLIGHMPALNVTFTDDEMEQLRAAAANGGVSLRTFVHQAALDAASDHKRQVREWARAGNDAGHRGIC